MPGISNGIAADIRMTAIGKGGEVFLKNRVWRRKGIDTGRPLITTGSMNVSIQEIGIFQ